MEPALTFRIGGKNLDPAVTKQFIESVSKRIYDDNHSHPYLWFAYEIAKHESKDYAGLGSRYNKVFTSFRKPDYDSPTSYDRNKDREAWAQSWPLYELDREGKRLVGFTQSGPGGYGIFQNTRPRIPRRELWYWQDSCIAGIEEIDSKYDNSETSNFGAKQRIDAVNKKYREACGAVPDYPIRYNGSKKTFSALDAMIVTLYNGTKELPLMLIPPYGKKKSPWQPEVKKRTWAFVENNEDYCESVFKEVE